MRQITGRPGWKQRNQPRGYSTRVQVTVVVAWIMEEAKEVVRLVRCSVYFEGKASRFSKGLIMECEESQEWHQDFWAEQLKGQIATCWDADDRGGLVCG